MIVKWKHCKYRIWVINTETESKLYLWEKWSPLMPYLDFLINLSKEQAFIRSFQSYTHDNRWLGFGRMKWDVANNIKWTTKYRNEVGSEDLLFLGTEIWSPDWNRVCRDGCPPDIFIKLYYFPTINKIKEGLVIAIPISIYKKNKNLIETQLGNIAKEISNSSIHTATRFWYPGWKISNEIGDMNNQEIEKIVYGK